MKRKSYKKGLAFFLTLAMAFTTIFGGLGFVGIDGAVEEVYAGVGSVSLTSGAIIASGMTYTISNAAELGYLATIVNNGQNCTGAEFQLTADITMNVYAAATYTGWGTAPPASTWTPIGTATNLFEGTFDGTNHKIIGLYFNNGDSDYIGLFGNVESGTIKNVVVESSYINGHGAVGSIVGAINNTGTVKNCSFGGIVKATDDRCGGIVGYAGASTIANCTNAGTINGFTNVGGIVGESYYTSVTSCSNAGAVTGSNGYAGGIIGRQTSSNVINCHSTGNISGLNYVGGVMGVNLNITYTYNCSNTGAVSATEDYAGGIVGKGDRVNLVNSYNTGAISGAYYVGGLNGWFSPSGEKIKNCYNAGSVTASGSYVGGLVGGGSYWNSNLNNCYWNTTLITAGGGAVATNGMGCVGKTSAEMQAAAFLELLNTNAQTINTADHIKSCSAWVNGTTYPTLEEVLTVSLNSNVGDLSVVSWPRYAMVKANHFTSLPPYPTNSSYRFDGWYTERSGGDKLTTATVINYDGQLYARWSPLLNSTTTKIKGVVVTNFGTSSTKLNEVAPGAVTLTAAQEEDLTNSGSYVTAFIPTIIYNTPPVMTTKAVKYANGADTSGFDGATVYNNEALTNGDFFVVKVTSLTNVGLQQDSSFNYYKIIVTSDPLLSITTANFDKYSDSANNNDVAVTKTDNGNTLNAIKNGATILTSGTDYTIASNDVILNKSYLATLATGTSTITFDYNNGTDPVLTITISNSAPTPMATPTASIDYANVQLTGLAAGEPYGVNSAAKTATDGIITIEDTWLDTSIKIVRKGNRTTTTDSAVQSLAIPAKPTAPSPTGVNPATLVGTGSITGVNALMEYKLTTGSWIAVPVGATSITGLSAGTYSVRVKATGSSFPSTNATVTITAFSGTTETTPSAAIDYANEALTGLTPSAIYLIGATEYTADGNGKIAFVDTWFETTLSLVKKGNATTTTNSAAQNIAVSARPIAPSPTRTNPTTIGGTGSITGVSDLMEYSSNGSSWTAVTASTTSVGGLTAGTYYVRVKSTGSSFAGTNATLTITAFGATQEATPLASVDYPNETLTGLTPSAIYIVSMTEYTANGSGEISINTNWLATSISIVKKGNALTTTNSDPKTLALAGRPATPLAGAFTVTQPSASGIAGTIGAITVSMQYSTNAGTSWTDGSGADLSIMDGTTVLIRVKATTTVPCSLNYSISITYTPSGGGGSGSGGGGSTAPTASTTINTNTGSVTGNQLTNAAGTAKTGETVTINANKTNEVKIPTSGLDSLKGKDNSLTVVTEKGTLTFDSKAVNAMGSQASGEEITVTVADVDKTKLTDEQQAKVGDKAIYDLTVMSGGKLISSFNGGKVNVSIPYVLKAGETADNVTVWYLADDGSLTEITCVYDAKTKSVTFVVNHFSKYVIGASWAAGWVNPFTDVKNADWYYDAAAYVNKNGFMNGQTTTTFDGEGAMTRGMFVTILGRMEGINTSTYASQKTFSDVKDTQYYTPYINWASEKNIVNGIGGDKFAPEQAVTREQMAVMMTNYMKFKNKGPVGLWAIQLHYSDLDKISSWTGDAVMFVTLKSLMTGIGNDANGNPLFAPNFNASRAQTAQVIMRLGELLK